MRAVLSLGKGWGTWAMRSGWFGSLIVAMLLAGTICSAKAADATSMSVADFVLDRASLKGRMVKVEGSASCLGADFCSVADPDQIMTSVMFEPAAISRADRKRLLSCNPITAPCRVTVTGRVQDNQMTPLAATAIVFAPTPEEVAAADPTIPSCDKATESDVVGMIEEVPLYKTLKASVSSAKIHSTVDERGMRHCKALVTMGNGYQMDIPYYLTRRDGNLVIIGNLLASTQPGQ